MAKPNNRATTPATLKRGLNLPLVALSGLGVTIGAGIYVLVGATAAKAGFYTNPGVIVAHNKAGRSYINHCFDCFFHCQLVPHPIENVGTARDR